MMVWKTGRDRLRIGNDQAEAPMVWKMWLLLNMAILGIYTPESNIDTKNGHV